MNKEGLILITKRQAKKLGSQAELAREVGIQCAELSLFLTGRRNPPARLLAYLGYKEKPTEYERIQL